MHRYFFHFIHLEGDPVQDAEGLLFRDDDAAKRAAILTLGEMIKDASSSRPMPYCVTIQVVREKVGLIDNLTGRLSSGS
jgi:hypothetical protein